MSIRNIKESLNNAFQGAIENINPKYNSLNDIIFGMHINPFETSMTFFTFIGLVVIGFGVLAGIVHVLMNLDKYNGKTTIKKTFLILLFLILGIGIILKSPGNDEYTPMDFSLIYIKNPDDISGYSLTDKPETGYVGESMKGIYGSPLTETGTEYLTIDLKGIFGEELSNLSNLNPIYKSDDYPQYKKFLLGMNGMEGKYKDMGITKSYISNLDLYDKDIPTLKNNDATLDSTLTNSSFGKFLFTIKDNKDKKRIGNIIKIDSGEEDFDFNTPINYEGDSYKFIAIKENGTRDDIILETTNSDGETKYLLLPYYDFVSILTQGNENGSVVAFLSESKESQNSKYNIPKDVKLTYKYLIREIYKLYPDLRSSENSENDTYNATIYDPKESNPLISIDLARMQYIVNYNVANGYKDIYNVNYLVKDVKKQLLEISKALVTQQSNLQEYKLKKSDIPKSKRIYIEKKLDEIQDKINQQYAELWSKLIKDKSQNVTKIYALNLQDIAVTPLSFENLGNNDRFDQNDKQKSHITLLQTVLGDGESVLTNKEQKTFTILNKIQKIDQRVKDINIVNKNYIIGYTLEGFVKYKKDFEIIGGADKKILEYVCDENDVGKFKDSFLELKSRLAINMDVQNIFDCSGNNGKGVILDKEKFKEFGNKIISAYKSRDLNRNIQIIPYLAKISSTNKAAVDNLVSTFGNSIESDSENAFLSKVLVFGKYKFISPFLYYKYLLTDKIDKIPGIFINLKTINGTVNVVDGTYDLKLGSKRSWYKELDVVNGNKYTKTLSFIPTTGDLLLLILFVLNQILIIGIFLFLLSTYLILLKKD